MAGKTGASTFTSSAFSITFSITCDAYEDFEGEDTFDLDAVDILTVHQSKGLEWPVVFLPSLVEGRFPSCATPVSLKIGCCPSRFSRRPFASDTKEVTPRNAGSSMRATRAKDVVYLSRFRRKTNKFKPSPFLLEIVGSDPALATDLPLPPTFTPSAESGDELPTVSFSELASYEGCPLKYRFSSSLGFQPQLVAELGYGRAIHHILRHIAEATKAKQQLPTLEEVEKVFAKEFYLPFANNAAFHNLLDRARSLVGKYLSDYSGELLRVWEMERPFESACSWKKAW